MAPKFLPKIQVLLLTISLLVPFLAACGRPATEAECREILRSAALLELKERLGNEQLIEEELQAIEKSMEQPMMEKCVGKRITEDKLACIRAAKTSDELFGECF